MFDDVLGYIKYDSGWKKKEIINFLDKDIELNLIFEGDKNETLSFDQQRAYLEYKHNNKNLLIPNVILNYYLANYDTIATYKSIPSIALKENVNENNILKFIRVKNMFFKKDGTYGYSCDCGWDIDHGIKIILSSSIPKVLS